MPGILEGIKVIEMGHFVAVPSAAVIIADWGADVIKIEPLTGDPQRGDAARRLKAEGIEFPFRFEIHNRNKRSLAIDLKKKPGRDIICDLIKSSDVFMSNYELDALDKLKMDYKTLSEINPAIIYAVLTGYGTVGPDKNERGFDYAAAWARSGIQYMLGEPGTPPPVPRPGTMDRVTGAYVVAGLLAALLHRERTGEGQKIEFSLFHTGVWTLAPDIQGSLLGADIIKHDRLKPRNPLVNSYCVKDGRWLQLAMLQADLQWPGFCKALDKPELEDDSRFNSIEARMDHCEELVRLLDETFATRGRDEWEERFRKNDCIYARIQTPLEVTTDPQALANNFFAQVEHPAAEQLKVVTTPVKFCQNPATIRAPSPELGQHTEEILLELGYTWDGIAKLKDEGIIL